MILLAQIEGGVFWLWLIVALIVIVLMSGFALFVSKCLKTVKPGQALIRTGPGGTQVSSDNSLVIPHLHDYELVTITTQKLSYERTGDWALKFQCGTRAELVADLLVRINQFAEDVKRATQFLGVETINDPAALKQHFSSMLNDSLETLAGASGFKDFASNKDGFREELLENIGSDLNGMLLDDICLHHLREL